MAALDEDGYFYIRDRKSDMIISGGINIYPWEIEDVLFSHPAVSEAAVIGKPDPEWGEIIIAYIVLKPGSSITEQEIVDFTKGRLASYKKPKEVRLIQEMPLGPTGKVLRRELKKLANG
jgi:acyl-CoA synthetase (AMP-forming)/AMP-acid ligase II